MRFHSSQIPKKPCLIVEHVVPSLSFFFSLKHTRRDSFQLFHRKKLTDLPGSMRAKPKGDDQDSKWINQTIDF